MNQEIDLDYLNARELLFPAYDTVILTLVGCGGTGSWLAPGIVRVARLLIEKFQKNVSLVFCDPDVVEQKNCYRQNFCEAEIGCNKAYALAFRYGLAWGLQILSIQAPFDGSATYRSLPHVNGSMLSIVVGCVDNAAGRKVIRYYVSSGSDARRWWIDCGNHKASGQVLLGCGGKSQKDPFELPGKCGWLPLPSDLHPELLEPETEQADDADVTKLSCADLAMLDSQGLAINQRIAAEATDYLVRMLLTRNLRKYATYIDLASGTTRSKYIVNKGDQDARFRDRS